MKSISSIALMSILPFTRITNGQGLQMPACMSACTLPFSSNHQSDRCTTSWIDKISLCIDDACSTTGYANSGETINIEVNASMTFVPKLQYACMQSYVPGSSNEPLSPALIVNNGECTSSPFGFLSFLPMYTDHAALEACTLQLFAEDDCVGGVSNMTVPGNAQSGVCSFESGKSVKLVCNDTTESVTDNSAAHTYLAWLCDKAAEAGTTATSTLTTLATTTSQVNPSSVFCPTGNVTMGAGNLTCSSQSANTTISTRTTAAIAPTVGFASTETGWSKADRTLEHNGAAMALVVVVFARSMML